MKKYRVSISAQILLATTVEADSEESAIDVAYNRDVDDVCYRCGDSTSRWAPVGLDLVNPADCELEEVVEEEE